MATRSATQQVVPALEPPPTIVNRQQEDRGRVVQGRRARGAEPRLRGLRGERAGHPRLARVAGRARAELEKHIGNTHVLITTPFHPANVGADRIGRAKNLELLLTAGIGSDHVDLPAAAAAGLTVAEVTGSNTVSVAEDQLMRILVLLRNFLPAHRQAVGGEWDLAAVAHRAYDLEGKTVGTVGAGRIGRLLLQRLKPFGCTLLYHDRLRVDAALEEELDAMLPKCDVVVLNMPLTDKTRKAAASNLGMFDKEKIGKMKRGVIIVNNTRGAIMDTQAVADACKSGHIAGYGGDVWYPQPAPEDHPWRYMPNNAMTPHISGITIDAQLRYAAGVKDMLERYSLRFFLFRVLVLIKVKLHKI
ncbi:hypothetical protein VPH35_092373 [Triticum aestivum]